MNRKAPINLYFDFCRKSGFGNIIKPNYTDFDDVLTDNLIEMLNSDNIENYILATEIIKEQLIKKQKK